MKIIILGGGQVGGTLAASLASEDSDITVIDIDEVRLRELRDRLDIGTISGMGSHPNVLEQAGIEDAELLIAVTSSDEINMIACQIAHTLYSTPTKIARVRSANYVSRKHELVGDGGFGIDLFIAPEQLVTNHVKRLIEHPGSLQVLDFAEGKVQLVAVKAYHDGPLVGKQLRALREHMPKIDTRVAAIFRKNKPIIPEGDTVIEVDDEVFFIAASYNIMAVMSELRRLDKPYKKITIVGGGNIGGRLAKAIENDYQVKLIEYSRDRCLELSDELNNTIVLQGNAADRELLLEENIEKTDVFIALTNSDEANIMSSMLAKRMGCHKVLTLINKPEFVDLIQGGEIDIAISPQQITIGSLLTKVRAGTFVNVHSLRRGAAEALEVIAVGDEKSSKVVGKRIEQISLPPGTTIGAIVRETDEDSEVIIAHHDTLVESNDHLIMFVVDKRMVRQIEKLFAVNLGYF